MQPIHILLYTLGLFKFAILKYSFSFLFAKQKILKTLIKVRKFDNFFTFDLFSLISGVLSLMFLVISEKKNSKLELSGNS